MPGIEANMMVVAHGGKEGCLRSVQHGDFKTQQITIETQRTRQIGHFQVNVTNAGLGGTRYWSGMVLIMGSKVAIQAYLGSAGRSV